MHTTRDVIKAFLGFSEKEKEEIRNFVNSTSGDVDFLVKAFDEEYVEEENYSPEDIAKLDRLQAEAEKGINMSPELEGEEITNYLDRLRAKTT